MAGSSNRDSPYLDRVAVVGVAVSVMITSAACSSNPTTNEHRPTPVSTAPSSSPSATPTTPSETAPSATRSLDQGRRVTIADDGATLHLALGGNADLVVRDPLAPEPTVSGGAVTLVEVDNATASGQRQWEVRAVAPGSSDVTATERGRTFTVHVVVA